MKPEPSLRTQIHCGLLMSARQRRHIDETFKAWEKACAWLAGYAGEHRSLRKQALHAKYYQAMRKRYDFPAQLTVRVITWVSRVIKHPEPFTAMTDAAIIELDAKCCSLLSGGIVSIRLLRGRERMVLDMTDIQRTLIEGTVVKRAMLLRKYAGGDTTIYLETLPGRPRRKEPNDTKDSLASPDHTCNDSAYYGAEHLCCHDCF